MEEERANSVSSFESQVIESSTQFEKKTSESQEKKGKSTLKGLIYGFGAATCYGLLLCAVK